MRKVLYIDFEGSLSKGIREIGYLIIKDEKISSSKEESGCEALKSLQNLQSDKYSYIVAHNSHIEKNLIRKYFPYQIDPTTETIRKHKWIDTLTVYRKLYPNLENYDLKSLIETFIDAKLLKTEAEKICAPTKSFFHHSLYDALCVYFLTKRLEGKINLKQFLSFA